MKNKAILLTLRLWWFYLIYKGKKTEEIRKTCPRDFHGDVYGYVSKTKWKEDLAKIPEREREFFKRFIGKVGLKFTLGKIREWHKQGDGWVWLDAEPPHDDYRFALLIPSGVDFNEFYKYTLGKRVCYSWHIERVIHFAEPRPLDDFIGIKRSFLSVKNYAPQSWCYCEKLKED